MKRKIYLASSWRNEQQPLVVWTLRKAGHEVYDFRNPEKGNNGFHWSEIDPNYESWNTQEYIQALDTDVAVNGFKFDWNAMHWADTGVLLLPCGRSAHLEAGYFAGAKKYLYIVAPEPVTGPELMYKMATAIYTSVEDLCFYL